MSDSKGDTGTNHVPESEKEEKTGYNLSAGLWFDNVQINGVKVAYYHICHTKLWLFSHNISLEKEHENVALGKILHEDRFKKENKEVTIDNTISVDFLKNGDSAEIHEVKKTKKMDESHRSQMLFYLYYFKQKGVHADGVINYPLLYKKENVVLTESAEQNLEKEIEDIKKIVTGKMPPPERKKICSKCAYIEFCFSGE